MVYVPGLTTRQNNFLAVGGAQKNIFFLFKSACLNIDLFIKKKNIFLGPPHDEKIILSRRQPWYINHLKI